MPAEIVNIVQLLCDLSESSDEVFSLAKIAPERDSGLQHLIGLGAIELGSRPESVACNACDADHSAVIEYDADRRCYCHFCPEAGTVTVDDVDLVTHRFRPEWLADWLTKALPITSPIGRPALVPGHVWHLGDFACGDTLVTVIFARRLSSQADLGQLASALRPIHPADKGLVITTSICPARNVPLPGGYELLLFPDIVRPSRDGLTLDTARLGSWIMGMSATTAKRGAARSGRPSQKDRTAEIYNARRQRGLPVQNASTEATKIQGEWRRHAPSQKPPGHSTVRRYVSQLAKASAPS